MREIKFRAKDWGGNLRYSSEFGFLHQFFLEFHLQKWACLGQFTGLYDKNGREIYEADGLEDEYGNFFGFVIFEDGCFTLNDDSLFWKIKENKLTVVGNIHEQEEK